MIVINYNSGVGGGDKGVDDENVFDFKTILTMSSRGRRLWHLISVYTFFPIVQHARRRT